MTYHSFNVHFVNLDVSGGIVGGHDELQSQFESFNSQQRAMFGNEEQAICPSQTGVA